MTGATTGLQKALARAGSSVVAIAELKAGELLAEMTDEQRAEMSAALGSASAGAEAMKPKKGHSAEHDAEDGEDDTGGDDEPMAQVSAPLNTNASVHERVKAVAAAVADDGPCKGKADLALAMLADDDYATLSASGIVKLLGKTPATTSASADDEASARSAMLAAIAENTNSNVDATGAGKPAKAQGSIAPWDKAIAGMNPTKAA